jgi:enoyl-CoA hydratase
MQFENVLYEAQERVALITLNRPKYRNAQSYPLLDELDAALDRAAADPDVRVAVVRGAGGNFSSGHDLGTPDQVAWREEHGLPQAGSGLAWYDNFRHYNYDLTIKWRNVDIPTIAMVEGFCIYGGWMIAAAMDLVFAAHDALLLPTLLEYYSVPYDIGPKRRRSSSSRTASCPPRRRRTSASSTGSIPPRPEAETMRYARRVAEGSPWILRQARWPRTGRRI